MSDIIESKIKKHFHFKMKNEKTLNASRHYVHSMIPILTKQTQSNPRIGSQGITFPLDPLSPRTGILE